MSEDVTWMFRPAKATVGTAVVADRNTYPHYWARDFDLVGKRVRVVRIEQEDLGVVYLHNEDDRGWKVIENFDNATVKTIQYLEIEPDSFAPLYDRFKRRKVLLVVSWDEPDNVTDETPFERQLTIVREAFCNEPGVEVHAAIRESADAILTILQGDEQHAQRS